MARVNVTLASSAIVVNAVAHAYTDELTPAGKFGTATVLQADNRPVRRMHLRFNLTGLAAGTIPWAVVRLTTTAPIAAGGDSAGEIRLVNVAWDELTIYHTNKPAGLTGTPGLDPISTVGAVSPSQTVDWDVTPAISG